MAQQHRPQHSIIHGPGKWDLVASLLEAKKVFFTVAPATGGPLVTVYCVITALKELGNQKNGFNFDASTVYMHDQYHGADERNFAITGNYSFGFDSERKLWGHSIDPRGFDLADYNRTRIALVRRDAPAI